jgi:ribosome biogenesis GTPase / thiamine phosphate phosphatase
VSSLESLGWAPRFADAFVPFEQQGFDVGRVAVQHRGEVDVVTAADERRVRGAAAVGDWVVLDPRGTIHAILPRKSAFSRMSVSGRTEEQVVAANVDAVFLVQSFGPDLNARRLERYLAAAWESGAAPVIVLTKVDLATAPTEEMAPIEAVALGVPVHPISSVTGEGLVALDAYLAPGQTVALLGSSGVGKSTLLNRLLGVDRFATGPLRDDGKGRHTTTNRELVTLPGGALVIDTPGMRELQLWVGDEALETTFEDVSLLAAQCRFADCAHETEPGCAVREALASGALSEERFESFRKLQRELAALAARQDAKPTADQRKEQRRFARAPRKGSY